MGQRRAVADLFRLQVYGVVGVHGIDQVYPEEEYERAQVEPRSQRRFPRHENPAREPCARRSRSGHVHGHPHPAGQRADPRQQRAEQRHPLCLLLPALGVRRVPHACSPGSAAQNGWNYLDLWDLVPMDEFTNSAVHLTPFGESLLAAQHRRGQSRRTANRTMKQSYTFPFAARPDDSARGLFRRSRLRPPSSPFRRPTLRLKPTRRLLLSQPAIDSPAASLLPPAPTASRTPKPPTRPGRLGSRCPPCRAGPASATRCARSTSADWNSATTRHTSP
ncbi:MAG: hypothetical protein M0C28_34710 [Candidatus Moduliflexus flocculans]|nr:hypothetical protein [Candidatus Moduliflexus flocculans]